MERGEVEVQLRAFQTPVLEENKLSGGRHSLPGVVGKGATSLSLLGREEWKEEGRKNGKTEG